MLTQSNFTPRIGSNDVASRVSTQIAVTQWNTRSTSAWRVTAPGDSARFDSVTGCARLFLLRGEERAIDGVDHDHHGTGGGKHPEQIPRHPLEDLAAVGITGNSEQLHESSPSRTKRAVRPAPLELRVANRARDKILQQRN